MELVTEPDMYSPSIDEIGNYIDKIPPCYIIKKGIQCPCGSRKDKYYDSHSIFSNHIKTKHHQNWLKQLNANKTNYYVENEKLKIILQNQRLVIANLEKEIQKKNMTILHLTEQIVLNSQHSVTNLLDYD